MITDRYPKARAEWDREDEYEEREGWRHIEAKCIVADWIKSEKIPPIRKNVLTRIHFEFPVGVKYPNSYALHKQYMTRVHGMTTEQFMVRAGELFVAINKTHAGITTDQLKLMGFDPYLIFDLAIEVKIEDRSSIDYGIEIVDSNPCNAVKREKLLRLHKIYGIKTFEINVEDVLNKPKPNNLPISRWITPQT